MCRLADDSVWVVRVAGRPPLELKGNRVGLSFRDADLFVFDGDGRRLDHHESHERASAAQFREARR